MNDDPKTKRELPKAIGKLKRYIKALEKSPGGGNMKDPGLESDEKFRCIFENTKDAMVYLDKKGFILDANNESLKIFGGSKEELVGKHFTKIEILSPENIISTMSGFKTFLAGEYTDVKLQIRNKKQQIFFLECSASLLKTAGKTTGMIVVVRDMTERKKAEEALQESEMRFRQFFENEPVYCYIISTEGKILDINSLALETLGYKKEEIVGRPFITTIYAPSCRAKARDLFSKWRNTGEIKNEELDIITKSGEERSVLLSVNAVKNADGEILHSISVQKDITDRKQTEDALRSSEERFRALAEMLPEAVFETDLNLRPTFVNRRAFELFGYDEDDLKAGISGFEMLAPEDRNKAKANMLRRMEGKDPGTVEYMALRKNGTTFPVLFHASSIIKNGALAGLRGIIIDITERKKAEKDLHDRLEMEELIMNISSKLISVRPDDFDSVINQALRDLGNFVEADRCYVFQYRQNGEMMDNSHEWCRDGIESLIGRLQNVLTGSLDMVNTPQKREQVYNIPAVSELSDEFKTDRREFEASGIKSILCVPMLFQRETIGFLGFDSVRKQRNWSRDTISLLKIAGEMIAGTIARKNALAALGSSEERYRQLVENSTEGIVVAQDRFVKFVNPRIEEISSYNREELLSKPFLDFIHPDDRQYVIENQLRRLNGELTPETYEIRMINRYGEIRWLRIGGVIITWEGRPASLNFVVDITETKRLKELESRAQRLEAAGQIAGQVAHDLNNLLAPLIAYPEFIREDLPENHSALPYLNDMERTAQQIADINQQLLTLGRRGHYNLEPINLNNVIRETLNELEPFPEALFIETELGRELMNIKAGKAQIHRLLSNVIHNSRDATRDIGRIIIKTENFYVEDTTVAYCSVPRGEYVKLTISDTGHGISENIIQKIFDPFFTTKTADKRKGSGLGLSVVDAVVKDHNGYIDLESKIGNGTTFYFYFPMTRDGVDDFESEAIIGGSEKVLVVDDDEMQRAVMLKILNSLGYRATAIESGEKALDMLRTQPQDLLLLDMIMPPGIDGAETFEKSLAINPSQKAIIVSGYAETDKVQKALELGAGAFIKKPLTRGKLAGAIRKELNRKEMAPAR